MGSIFLGIINENLQEFHNFFRRYEFLEIRKWIDSDDGTVAGFSQ